MGAAPRFLSRSQLGLRQRERMGSKCCSCRQSKPCYDDVDVNTCSHTDVYSFGGAIGKSEHSTAHPSALLDKPVGVRTAYTQEVTVVVSDLIGFTKSTREYGIQHFASLIVRKRQLCLPIIHRYGAVHVGTEADNLILVFLDAKNAAKAAVAIRHVIRVYNESLDAEQKPPLHISLNGIGVHCAPGLVIDREGGVHGEALRLAYHWGEDLAENGDVLISNDVKARLGGDPSFARATYSQRLDKDSDMPVFAIAGDFDLQEEVVPADDDRFLHPGLMILASRHLPQADIRAIDEKIAATLLQTFTVLMLNLNLNSVVDISKRCALKFKASDFFRPIVSAHSGTLVEDVLWLFKDPHDAVLAALATRKALGEHNSEVLDADNRIDVVGYGAHVGKVLIIRGTDVHWGNPVNTASKLGQDVAEGGDILIMPEVKEGAEVDERFAGVKFVERAFQRSGVEFVCFSVQDAACEGSSPC